MSSHCLWELLGNVDEPQDLDLLGDARFHGPANAGTTIGALIGSAGTSGGKVEVAMDDSAPRAEGKLKDEKPTTAGNRASVQSIKVRWVVAPAWAQGLAAVDRLRKHKRKHLAVALYCPYCDSLVMVPRPHDAGPGPTEQNPPTEELDDQALKEFWLVSELRSPEDLLQVMKHSQLGMTPTGTRSEQRKSDAPSQNRQRLPSAARLSQAATQLSAMNPSGTEVRLKPPPCIEVAIQYAANVHCFDETQHLELSEKLPEDLFHLGYPRRLCQAPCPRAKAPNSREVLRNGVSFRLLGQALQFILQNGVELPSPNPFRTFDLLLSPSQRIGKALLLLMTGIQRGSGAPSNPRTTNLQTHLLQPLDSNGNDSSRQHRDHRKRHRVVTDSMPEGSAQMEPDQTAPPILVKKKAPILQQRQQPGCLVVIMLRDSMVRRANRRLTIDEFSNPQEWDSDWKLIRADIQNRIKQQGEEEGAPDGTHPPPTNRICQLHIQLDEDLLKAVPALREAGAPDGPSVGLPQESPQRSPAGPVLRTEDGADEQGSWDGQRKLRFAYLLLIQYAQAVLHQLGWRAELHSDSLAFLQRSSEGAATSVWPVAGSGSRLLELAALSPILRFATLNGFGGFWAQSIILAGLEDRFGSNALFAAARIVPWMDLTEGGFVVSMSGWGGQPGGGYPTIQLRGKFPRLRLVCQLRLRLSEDYVLYVDDGPRRGEGAIAAQHSGPLLGGIAEVPALHCVCDLFGRSNDCHHPLALIIHWLRCQL